MSALIVITSSPGSWADLAPALADVGVRVQTRPLLGFVPPGEWSAVDAALRGLRRYTAGAVTSPRAAGVFRERAAAVGAEPPGWTWWASGERTAEALGVGLGEVRVVDPAEVGRIGAGAAIARAMLEAGCGSPVLFPCGDPRRDELPASLRAAGVEVDEVICYRTVVASTREAREAVHDATAVVVASPTVAELLARTCAPEHRPLLVAAGPTTAAAATVHGWKPDATAERATTAALAAALRPLLSNHEP